MMFFPVMYLLTFFTKRVDFFVCSIPFQFLLCLSLFAFLYALSSFSFIILVFDDHMAKSEILCGEFLTDIEVVMK